MKNLNKLKEKIKLLRLVIMKKILIASIFSFIIYILHSHFSNSSYILISILGLTFFTIIDEIGYILYKYTKYTGSCVIYYMLKPFVLFKQTFFIIYSYIYSYMHMPIGYPDGLHKIMPSNPHINLMDSNSGGTSTGETSTRETSIGETSTREISTGGTSTGETSTGETSEPTSSVNPYAHMTMQDLRRRMTMLLVTDASIDKEAIEKAEKRVKSWDKWFDKKSSRRERASLDNILGNNKVMRRREMLYSRAIGTLDTKKTVQAELNDIRREVARRKNNPNS